MSMMRVRLALHVALALVAILSAGLAPAINPGRASAAPVATPPNLKVAFFGDQGTNPAVLQLIRAEQAEAAVLLGDFDYLDNPAAWDAQVTQELGAAFPLLGVVGNHDTLLWPEYRQKLLDRAARAPAILCQGDYGVNAACSYKGLFLVLSGAGTLGSGHDAFIRQALASDSSIWRVCAWHKLQQAMQVGAKLDEAGWGPYEECRRGRAIIATAHEHSYSRTRTLSSVETQTVDSAWQDPGLLRVGSGSTFAFVSGAGGHSLRPQARCLPATPPYGCKQEWASIFTTTQGANFGALFLTFNVDGNPNKARGYFKTVDGRTVDSFTIFSEPGAPAVTPSPGQGTRVEAQVAASSDDAYHTPNGFPGYSHTDGAIYAGARGSNGSQWGGWRWTGLDIPSGARITEAYVILNQEGWGYSISTTLALESSASPATFSSADSPFGRWVGRTTFSVPWSWPKATPGTWIQTPSLAFGLQELVDRYGGLSALVLLESGEGVPQGAYHSWKSFDSASSPGMAAKLVVTYTTGASAAPPPPSPTPEPSPTPPPAPPPGKPVTVEAQVAASSDDAYHTPAGFPNYSHVDGAIYAGARGSNGPQWDGWRWTGLNIPAGARITEAYVLLNQEGWGYSVTTTLALENSANPATFSSGDSPFRRWGQRTTFSAPWSWSKAKPGSWVQTPSLAAGLQELVDRHGGLNAIVLLESGEGVPQGAYHSWRAFDSASNPGMAAKLVVTYTMP